MKNNSAVGPNGVGYKLLKAVRDTKMGEELLMEVVQALRGATSMTHGGTCEWS